MNALKDPDMIEATRLTRKGRLAEATALLQRALAGRRSRGETVDPRDAAAATTLDMVRPSAPDGSWSAPVSGFHRPKSRTASPTARSDVRPKTPRETAFRPDKADALVPPGALFEQRSIATPAGRRNYKVFVPSGADTAPLPLVVMLHGCTQSPDDFAAGTRMNALAEQLRCVVAYPEQPASANPSKCWNWFKRGDQMRDRGEPSLIAEITRQVMRDHSVDPRRVFVAGLSAGGAAAAIMGQMYPDLYAGVCVHSGLACGAAQDMPSAFAAMRNGGDPGRQNQSGLRTIIFHGSADTTVNPRNAHAVAHQFSPTGAMVRTTEHGVSAGGMAYDRVVDSDAAGLACREQWILHGAAHAWSGGSPAGSYTDPRGPDASREMMRFFLKSIQKAE